MKDDSLENLLRRADAAAGTAPHLSADLPRRVRHLAQRRRRIIVAGRTAAAAALVLAIGTALLVTSETSGPRPGVTAPVARDAESERGPAALHLAAVPGDVARLRAEADLRLEIIRRTAAIRQRRARLAELEHELARPDPVRLAEAQVERTASVLVHQADNLYRTPALRASAIKSYRRTVELFPATHSARVARARLAEIEATPGDS